MLLNIKIINEKVLLSNQNNQLNHKAGMCWFESAAGIVAHA